MSTGSISNIRSRSRRALLRLLLCCALLLPVARPAVAQVQPADPHSLELVEVQLSGATRTSLATVSRYLPLEKGQAIDQATLVRGVDALRASGLFKSVSFYTRPGAQRGQLILVLEVVEQGLDFRWAAGNTNLDGWYLSPAMLAYDNALGKGRILDLQWRLGFRHNGLLLRYGQPRAGDGRNYWGLRLSALTTDRPYFTGGVEYRHEVDSGGLGAVFGRRLSEHRLVELGVLFDNVTVAPTSTAYTAAADGSLDAGQTVGTADLPPEIAAAVGEDSRVIMHLDWQHDTRSARLRAGSPVSGVWGRLKGHYVAQEDHSHAGAQADLRVFTEIPGGVLAGRMRGAWVGDQAAFYDRLYLGGMYSVRGFPTHALSAPGGDTWLWSTSLEYRSRILGDGRGTRLAGLFFVDAGASGTADAADPYPGVAASAGYGVRWRVWWLDWVGVDVGFPLTERPLDMRFQATASIGWSF